MSHLSKALILGFIVGVVGLGISVAPFGIDLEENVALELLFHLRGVNQAPSDVVVVSIDQESAQNLNIPNDPRKWPRSLHARLTENLARRGAAVIAFDLIFDESKSPGEDKLFAETIRKAGNVLLCEYLKRDKVPLGKARSMAASLNIEKVIPPIPLLAQSAIGLAPFPLPKVPVKVSQYWTFKTEAGGMPTLPVVAFQIFAMPVYGEFIRLLKQVNPSQAERLIMNDKDIVVADGSVEI
jgi:adenylate cyclase